MLRRKQKSQTKKPQWQPIELTDKQTKEALSALFNTEVRGRKHPANPNRIPKWHEERLSVRIKQYARTPKPGLLSIHFLSEKHRLAHIIKLRMDDIAGERNRGNPINTLDIENILNEKLTEFAKSRKEKVLKNTLETTHSEPDTTP